MESDTETLGKTSGVDRARGKATYPSVMGMDASKKLAEGLEAKALDAIENLGTKAHLLREMAYAVIRRTH